jgi:hypothetical protein
MNHLKGTWKRHLGLAIVVFAVCLLATGRAEAAGLYANWQKVKQINYLANYDAYLVSFEGEPYSASENCTKNDFAIVKASATGVATDDQQVDRLVAQLYVAVGTGQKARAWVSGCDPYNGFTYPKIYSVWLLAE